MADLAKLSSGNLKTDSATAKQMSEIYHNRDFERGDSLQGDRKTLLLGKS